MGQKTLEYYFENGDHIVFEKYTISTDGIITHKYGKRVSAHKVGEYNRCCVRENDGKRRHIFIGRALVSTFRGPPPSISHTVDHEDQNPINDTLENTRWLCKSGQANNRTMPETNRSAFVIIRDGVEKAVKEWVEYFMNDTNPFGREYTESMIYQYAKKNQHGFSYKTYPDLPSEVWKIIDGSDSGHTHWEISNMNRIKYVTKFAENVLAKERLGLRNGYPVAKINGKVRPCHILSFVTFFPDNYNSKKTEEIVLHEDDDKMDFRPHKLRIGTGTENITSAHDNGKYNGAKSMRMKCASYINDVLEKVHISQSDAAIYLKSVGYGKATVGGICQGLTAFRDGNDIVRYGRTWKLIAQL
jgi:hypothetical protein